MLQASDTVQNANSIYRVISFATKHKTQGYKEHEYNWRDCLFTQSFFFYSFQQKALFILFELDCYKLSFVAKATKEQTNTCPSEKPSKSH